MAQQGGGSEGPKGGGMRGTPTAEPEDGAVAAGVAGAAGTAVAAAGVQGRSAGGGTLPEGAPPGHGYGTEPRKGDPNVAADLENVKGATGTGAKRAGG